MKQLTRVEEQLCSEARDFLLQAEIACSEDHDEGDGDSGEDSSTTFAGHNYRLKPMQTQTTILASIEEFHVRCCSDNGS